jgi:hypothetical protein
VKLAAAALLIPAVAAADAFSEARKQALEPFPESPPDPSATTAAEANLESTARRRGFNLTLAGGGGLTVGFGVEDAVGNGGSGTLRIGRVATPRTQLTLELSGVVLLHTVEKPNGTSGKARNEDSNLLAGFQFYVNRSLWIRGAFGIGGYTARQVPVGRDAMGNIVFGEVTLAGPAGAVGAGIDILRFRRFSVGLEAMSIGMINREGILSSNGFMVDITIE